MGEVALFDTYPEELTYPEILPVLFEKVKECFLAGNHVKKNAP